jgi:4-methyl-5(b-hydroxyethyl)-thiazole monophosphate biosynthesis
MAMDRLNRPSPGEKEAHMSKKVLVPVADGTEELEAVATIDVLRRAGASVTVASVAAVEITASRGVRLVADCLIADCVDETYDAIALPGGIPGAEHLRDSQDLLTILRRQKAEGRIIAAICAAPAVILVHHGLIASENVTCHPFFTGQLGDRKAVEAPVVVDGAVLTSRGAGTAVPFALKLVEMLFGRDAADAVAGAMVTTHA